MCHAGAGDPTPCPGVPNLPYIVGTSWGDTDMALKIKRARKTVPLVTDLSLAAEHERAVNQLQQAQRRAKQEDRGNAPEVKAAAARVLDLEAAMQAETVYVELEAWQRKRWAEFEEANPPREGNDTDKAFNVDLGALDGAIADMIVAAVDHEDNPVEFTAATWAEVADDLSQGQWEPFALAVLSLNRQVADAPFSVAASKVTRSS